ncbi:MAG: phosphodiester glycosidase family protein [Abditibacteriota bacterium]|nr:phosphodiester glycosidase family protein [Abditibacteriota bacterium]
MKRMLCLTALLLTLTAAAFAGPQKTIVPGVTLEQTVTTGTNPLVVNTVRVDLSRPDIHVKTALGDETVSSTGRQGVSSMTGSAVVGVNADYFIMNGFRDPLNLCLRDGELLSEPGYGRTVIGFDAGNKIYMGVPEFNGCIITASGERLDVTGIDRARNQGERILYTGHMGPTTRSKYAAADAVLKPEDGDGALHLVSGRSLQVLEVRPSSVNTPIPKGCFVLSAGGELGTRLCEALHAGDTVTLTLGLSDEWSGVVNAVGGGPQLVRNGAVFVTGEREGFKADILKGRAPRSAVGFSADRKTLIIMTVDGRQKHSQGATLSELAALMIAAGARDAMNLDGGGSTALSVFGLVLNSPSERTERAVADCLTVLSDYRGTPIDFDPGLAGTVYRADQVYSLPLPDDADPDRLVWGTGGGIGYTLTDNMLRTCSVSSRGTVGFVYDGVRYSWPVEVSAAPLDKAECKVSYYDPERKISRVYFRLLDKAGHPMIYSPVFVKLEGGVTGRLRHTTDSMGASVFDAVWEAPEGERSVTFSIGSFEQSFVF